MLHAVGAVEDADQEPLAGPVQGVEEHPLALLVQGARLLQEGLLVDDPGVEGLRVLGQAEGTVLPQAPAQAGGVRGRMGEGQAGTVGIDLDRREVEPQGGRGGQEEAADAAHPGAGAAVEGQLHPGGMDALAQLDPPAGGGEQQAPGAALQLDRGMEGRVAVPEGRGRPREQHPAPPVIQADLDVAAGAVLADPFLGRGLAQAGELALGPPQVGDAHARQQVAGEGLRRKGDGHAQDGAEHALVAEQLPEGLAALEIADAGPRQGQAMPSDLQAPGRRHNPRRGEDRSVGPGVAGDEVVDVVAGGVGPGGEGGPGRRRDRRQGGPEGPERPLAGESLQVRQAPLVHPAGAQSGVETVETDDDDAPGPGFGALPPAEPGQQHPEGQEEEDRPGEEEDEEGPEAAGDGEARARADVAMGRHGQEDGKGGEEPDRSHCLDKDRG